MRSSKSSVHRIIAMALLGMTAPSLGATLAVTNARIVTMGQAGEIESGTIIIRDGKIAAVGAGVAIPNESEVIDAAGRLVIPGFILSDSALGAVEVNSLGSELSPNTPGVTAAFDVQYGLNPSSAAIPVARLGGITRAVVIPTYGGGGSGHRHDTAGAYGSDVPKSLFTGQAAVVHLGGGDSILVRPKVAMGLVLGEEGAKVSGGARGSSFVWLKTVLDDVRWYKANRRAYNAGVAKNLSVSRPDLEALMPVVEGRMPLVVSVHRASDIRQVIRFAQDEGVKVILNGAAEGWRVAEEIAAAGMPVILNPISNLPGSFETLGATQRNAALLDAAGVAVIIKSNENGAHRAREARYNAGNAVAHGMPHLSALKALTINPAKAFGISDRVGSIEVGKEADLVIWNGDPLEPLSQPEAIVVKGEQQPLWSRAFRLRDRYRHATDESYSAAYR